MKKSLIALAVMAAAGAASAQSSVQLYGIADIWFGSTSYEYEIGGVKTKTPTQTRLEDGGISNSRIGLKGSEDLGGGLKVNFQVEKSFALDTGSADSGFDREAWVGLSGGFGEVRLGRTFSAFDDVSALASSVFDSDLAPINTVFDSTWAASSFSNTVKYVSPEISGFSGSASYSLGEDKGTDKSASSTYALSGKYAAGPLAVGVGYAKWDDGENGTDQDTYDALRIAGSYDFGAVKLLASFGRTKEDWSTGDWKSTEWEIGADVPLASNLTLSVGYARASYKYNGMDDGKTTGFGAAVAYNLSKRTTVYAGLNQTKGKSEDSYYKDKSSVYAVGLKHTF